jgi:hypothetical protein
MLHGVQPEGYRGPDVDPTGNYRGTIGMLGNDFLMSYTVGTYALFNGTPMQVQYGVGQTIRFHCSECL